MAGGWMFRIGLAFVLVGFVGLWWSTHPAWIGLCGLGGSMMLSKKIHK